MLRGPALVEYDAEIQKGSAYKLLNALARLGPNHWWAYTQLIIPLTGAAIPLLGYFGL